MAAGIPSNFANAVAPFVPVGRTPVGQELEDLRHSALKPLEQPAESVRSENFRSPDQRPNDIEQRHWLQRHGSRQNQHRAQEGEAKPRSSVSESLTLSDSGLAALHSERMGGAVVSRGLDGESRQTRERQVALDEREVIQELAARDREVRRHEQAHAALGGQYAGAPRYQYERGPDGVAYAVSGEVPIDTSEVPNDPRATIEKAQQIRRAAFAPAEPSEVDRRVAAAAARMEAEARLELRQQQREEVIQGRGDAADEKSLIDAPRNERDDSAAREQWRGKGADENRSERQEARRDERWRNVQVYVQLGEIAGRAQQAPHEWSV